MEAEDTRPKCFKTIHEDNFNKQVKEERRRWEKAVYDNKVDAQAK